MILNTYIIRYKAAYPVLYNICITTETGKVDEQTLRKNSWFTNSCFVKLASKFSTWLPTYEFFSRYIRCPVFSLVVNQVRLKAFPLRSILNQLCSLPIMSADLSSVFDEIGRNLTDLLLLVGFLGRFIFPFTMTAG